MRRIALVMDPSQVAHSCAGTWVKNLEKYDKAHACASWTSNSPAASSFPPGQVFSPQWIFHSYFSKITSRLLTFY
jgi:hypothetical protein